MKPRNLSLPFFGGVFCLGLWVLMQGGQAHDRETVRVAQNGAVSPDRTDDPKDNPQQKGYELNSGEDHHTQELAQRLCAKHIRAYFYHEANDDDLPTKSEDYEAGWGSPCIQVAFEQGRLASVAKNMEAAEEAHKKKLLEDYTKTLNGVIQDRTEVK